MFARRHYEAVAQALAQAMAMENTWRIMLDKSDAIELVAGILCDVFQKDNPRFNRKRFLCACGIAVCLNSTHQATNT